MAEENVLTSEKTKILIIGLDGATFDLILPWIKNGKLPNFSFIMENGVYGELRSTIPILTPPAWSSFMTGKNPGKHGVMGFFSREKNGYGIKVTNSTHRRAKEIWTMLSENGKTVGMVNVPITYPPKKVNGFMITGMMTTPPKSEDYTYPPFIREELEKIAGRRTLDPLFTYLESEGVFINEAFDSTEKLEKISLFFMEKYKPDFFMVVFNGTDYLQHRFWRHIDPEHPMYEAEKSGDYMKIFFKYYQKTDEILGNFLKKANDKTTIIIMSDHGAGPLYKYIHVNSWLMQMGLLKLNRKWTTKLKYFVYRLGFGPEKIYNSLLSMRLGSIPIKTNRSNTKIRAFLNNFFVSFSDVDWLHTKAYSMGSGLIYINVKGREPSGIVNPGLEYESLRKQIINKLYRLKDHETGESIIEKVYTKEEIYSGPYLDTMPDIVFIPKSGYMTFEEYEFAANSVITQSEAVSSTHKLNGILLMKSPGVKRGLCLQNAEITDIAPTVLYLLGLPIPEDMDGKVLVKALTSSYLSLNPINYSTDGKGAKNSFARKEEVYSREDEDELKSRLRELGYLS
jgi:predicted AlkP superfamily phosphohydrolase/phosphomutase